MRFSIKLLLLAAAVLVVAVASRWLLRTSETATAAQEQSAPQRIGRPRVPVLAGTAEAKDVPIIVRGIGSVQAYNMVTVKSRVDGNIVKVAFTEGQYVHQGNVLMQIDPRPYQAQLEQAEANKAKDQANLETPSAISPVTRQSSIPSWRCRDSNTTPSARLFSKTKWRSKATKRRSTPPS